MFSTTVIPTIGREVLRRAVCSVLEQDFSNDDFEIIVVNDSGSSLPKAEWQNSTRVRIVDTSRVERCVARNVGASLAQGRYLHFLDDDDWLLPGALRVFWEIAQKDPITVWLYGGTMLFDRQEKPIIRLIHRLEPNCFAQVMTGEWIPLQASFIREECFHKVGGFNPLIPGVEDMDLARRMALLFDFKGTAEPVAAVGMGIAGSTTDQTRARLLGRQAREAILSQTGVYKRLWHSAHNAFWRGRIVRIYLTSAYLNLGQGRLFGSMSRILFGLSALLRSVFASPFAMEFWRAMIGQYESEAFARGFSERKTSPDLPD